MRKINLPKSYLLTPTLIGSDGSSFNLSQERRTYAGDSDQYICEGSWETTSHLKLQRLLMAHCLV